MFFNCNTLYFRALFLQWQAAMVIKSVEYLHIQVRRNVRKWVSTYPYRKYFLLKFSCIAFETTRCTRTNGSKVQFLVYLQSFFQVVVLMFVMSWCSLAANQLLSHSLSSTGQRKKIIQKSLWVEIKTGTSLNNNHYGQNRLTSKQKKMLLMWPDFVNR